MKILTVSKYLEDLYLAPKNQETTGKNIELLKLLR